ncbi:nickel transporter permease [Bosea sp. 2RAB26]|uniref:nickel transporter permease n=1 Tax=Bosea sp. 2RAB26 TaxID=3237476 RepID=UPI003F92E15E
MTAHSFERNASLRSWLLAEAPQSGFQAWMQSFYLAWLRLAANPLAVIGVVVLLVIGLVALMAPWIATHSPFDQVLAERFQRPSAAHWLGTDELGRDVFSRIVYGARTTLYIVGLVAVIVGPIGLCIGATAGYLGGWVEALLMRITDIFLSFPSLILALAFVSALGPSLDNAIIAIALSSWPGIARLARAETLTIRSSDYVDAVRVMGASTPRIIFKHVMPMCLPSVVVRVTLSMASVALTAAGLGFLGLGAQPPTPEWGAMLSTARQYLLEHWYLAAMPGLAILTVSLAFNLFGDGLRDMLNPRS